MFEHDHATVDELLKSNRRFRALHEQHRRLDEEVTVVEQGNQYMDDHTLVKKKKEKLLMRDEMAAMIDAFKRPTN